MDIELLREIAEPVEEYIFIDSEDQRLYLQKADFSVVLRDSQGFPMFDSSGNVRYIVDSAANRLNTTFDYVVTFDEPFQNVISVEIMEAWLPVSPILQDISNPGSLLRYITVSCPEIEAFLTRSRGRLDFSTSMAKICWESLEKTYLRYTKPFKTRVFHPVGKIGKLRFQFYRNNTTTAMNFAGAHHMMTLCVVSLKPKMKPVTNFILNPEYTPGGGVPNHFISAQAEDSDSD